MCLLGVQVVTDNLADLRKIIAMRGNRLGAALMGGDGGDAKDRPAANAMRRASRALECRWFPDPRTFQSPAWPL